MGVCEEQKQAAKDAAQDSKDAFSALGAAVDTFEDAGGIFDDSSFGDAGGVATGMAACASNPVGWVVCGLGILAGLFIIVQSELDRADEIDAAVGGLIDAWGDYWDAHAKALEKVEEHLDCLEHEITKALRDNP